MERPGGTPPGLSQLSAPLWYGGDMSAHLSSLAWTLEEFLDWERGQELRYEFDGVQPVAMRGGPCGTASWA